MTQVSQFMDTKKNDNAAIKTKYLSCNYQYWPAI